MFDVAVIVATFGNKTDWDALACRAMDSAFNQTLHATSVLRVHHPSSLSAARNAGASKASSEWLIFLDADDELDAGYVAAMAGGEGDIRRPATIGIYGDGSMDSSPVMIPRRDLRTANYIVVGAMCSRHLFERVGGFPEYPALEDWALWRKMVAVGAQVGDVPAAIYKVHVRTSSRNNNQVVHGQCYQRILRECPL